MLAMLASIAAWAAVISNGSVPAQAAMINDETNLDWVSLRDLTSAAFSAAFTRYSGENYLMIDVDAYPHGSELRYSMVWRKNIDGRGWAEHRNLSSARYHQLWQKYRDLGYRPLDVEGYMQGSDLRFAGIWVENKEGFSWSSRRGMTSREYANYFQEQRAAGRRPIDIEVYQTGNTTRFIRNSSHRDDPEPG
jgi:hypothetical protein